MIGLCRPQSVAGQATAANVYGTVIDEESGKPVSAALVTLQEAELSGETSARGRFAFAHVPAGTYTMVVERIGYDSRREQIDLNPGVAVEVTIQLSTRPVELKPIDVVTRSGKLAEVGFYDRRYNGGLSGHYITYDDLERRNAMGLTDVLYDVPGVRVFKIQPGRTTVRFNRYVPEVGRSGKQGRSALSEGGNPLPGCEPDLYVDGRIYLDSSPPMVTGGDLGWGDALNKVDDFNAIPVSQIAAVEVFVGAAVPSSVYNTACGVILIWTKR